MRLHHHALSVVDMDLALKSFCDLMGMKFITRGVGTGKYLEYAFVEETKTGHRMELVVRRDGQAGSIDHIAYEVEDVDQAFERLKKSGMEVDQEPVTISNGKVRLAHLRDRIGFIIQLIHYS